MRAPIVTGLMAGLLASLVLMATSGRVLANPTEEQLSELRQDMAKLQARLDEELAARNDALAALAKTQQAINKTQNTIDQVAQQQQSLKERLEALYARQQDLNAQSQRALQALTELLIKGYPVSKQSTLKALLNQTRPGQAARLMAYHRILSAQTMTRLGQITDQIAAAVTAQQEIDAQLDALAQLQSEQTERMAQMAELRRQRQADLEQLNARIVSDTDRLEALRADEQRLAEVLTEASEALPPDLWDDEVPPVTELKGQLPMPVAGTLVKRFGQRRQNQARWRGWLIKTAEQAPVHAIAPGRVVYADWLRGYGLLIIVDHQQALLSLYAHNDRLFFEVGDWVRMGDRLGVASTPGRDPLPDHPGIYFELRHQGQPTDPAAWLNASRRPSSP